MSFENVCLNKSEEEYCILVMGFVLPKTVHFYI